MLHFINWPKLARFILGMLIELSIVVMVAEAQTGTVSIVGGGPYLGKLPAQRAIEDSQG